MNPPEIPESPWTERALAVLDCESTGVDTQTARIVQLAFVRVLPDGTIDDAHSLCTLVNPGVAIPAEATAVHGITDDQVRVPGVPTTATALAAFAYRLGSFWAAGDCVAVMNAPYDIPLVESEWARCARDGILPVWPPVLDPLVLDRHLDRYRPGRRNLAALCQHYGVPLSEAHDARADAIATARVLLAIAARYPSIAHLTPQDVHARQVQWHRTWRDGVNGYWARRGDPRRATEEWPGLRGAAAAASGDG